MTIDISISQNNRLHAECEHQGDGVLYSFQLIKDGNLISKLFFSQENSGTFWLTDAGEYQIKVIAENPSGIRTTAISQSILYQGTQILIDVEKRETSPLLSAVYVLREISENWHRMFRIAIYDHRIRDKDSYLGKIWTVLNPLLQVLIFWFVFGLGFRGGKPIDGFPYLLWMLCGLFPWFFVSAGLTGGSVSVYAKAGTVLRMQYPLATIPLGNILVSFFDHLIIMGLLFLVELGYGFMPRLSWISIVYYWIFSMAFLTAFSMVSSTLTMIARDFQKLLTSLIRLLFYMSPILWSLDSMPEFARGILALNPVAYIVDGYRDSLLYGVNFWEHKKELIFFWGITVFFFVLGSWLHRKYRDSFIDFL